MTFLIATLGSGLLIPLILMMCGVELSQYISFPSFKLSNPFKGCATWAVNTLIETIKGIIFISILAVVMYYGA